MIICAALKISHPDFKPDNELIIPCLRHGWGYSMLHTLVGKGYNKFITEGFVDENGHFMDRHEALTYALNNGQLSATAREWKRAKGEGELYSEDLY